MHIGSIVQTAARTLGLAKPAASQALRHGIRIQHSGFLRISSKEGQAKCTPKKRSLQDIALSPKAQETYVTANCTPNFPLRQHCTPAGHTATPLGITVHSGYKASPSSSYAHLLRL
ncbi:hypothetical protein Nepgr_021455 [Nepenthes gracilis]|uniref:Uncharacterized protein n=1 Tax=Nepenthes gracilis TaxID=150966 RepID=A0AAD3SYN3_NEPGR|nr:hypothetical protein Nepgr_021455 [Nepenthes gracilis]